MTSSNTAQGTLGEHETNIVSLPMLIERRFVPDAREFPFRQTLHQYPQITMVQAYLTDEYKTTVREEFHGDKIYIYKERKKDGPWRVISSYEYGEKLQSAVCTLRKTRTILIIDGVEVFVDEYEGKKLAGYMQVRVLFHAHDSAYQFQPPSWFGPEVTHRRGLYSGFMLAKQGRAR